MVHSLLYGLRSASCKIPRTRYAILLPNKVHSAVGYVEDRTMLSQIAYKRKLHIHTLLWILHKASFMQILKKSKFHLEKINYFAQIIPVGNWEWTTISNNIIIHLKILHNLALVKLYSFRGLCNVYCRIILNFAFTAVLVSRSLKLIFEDARPLKAGRAVPTRYIAGKTSIFASISLTA